jgi:hypothetical protein
MHMAYVLDPYASSALVVSKAMHGCKSKQEMAGLCVGKPWMALEALPIFLEHSRAGSAM